MLDDCRTEGLSPPKSHWARRIETAPFYAYPQDGKPAVNIFAAGEIMAGNVLGRGYAAGIGMTIGSVFGRVAGREAARHALK